MDSPLNRFYNLGLSAGGEGQVRVLRRLGVRWRAVGVAAGMLALLAAGATLALAVSAGAAPLGALDDTTAPVPTQPTPDPAPARKPAPKPKPTPKPTATAPKRTDKAPTRTYSAPTYTAPRSARTPKSTKPQVVRKPKRHQKKAQKPVVTTTVPAETTTSPLVLIPVPLSARRPASRASGESMVTSVLFIAGVSFAALLFLLAATVPGTPARFTPVGRVVIEHQQDLVLVGIAAFMITVFVYLLTGHGL
jgi:hypothetical protein